MNSDPRINILVVDDVPDKLIAIETILEELGQNVVSVSSGREALRQLLHEDFALILLDVNMPEMDGFETASLIRKRKKSEDTPIIFITGFSDETHVARGYSLGAVDYILTPVVPEVLRAKVAVFVDLYRKTELVKRQAEQQVAMAREQAARASAEEATRRSEFLANASTLLAASLDYDATVANAVKLPISKVADICVIDVMGDRRRVERPTVACVRRELEAQLTALGVYPLGPIVEASSRRVMQAGHPERLRLRELSGAGSTGDSAGLAPDFLPQLASAIVLPLFARGKVRGTLALARFADSSHPESVDESLAEDLAGRIAIAIDNAYLFRKIQEADRRKDEFLATLSHELRNPLAAITNALQCMEIPTAPAAMVDESRSILKRQVSHVVRLVEDLLDVSRITRGKVRLRKEVVDLKPIVEQAVVGARPLIDERRHELIVSLPATPLNVVGDSTRLEQVIGNLLHNAAKYTDPGGRISLTGVRVDGGVEIRVKDSGAGIAADLLPKIFDLFSQGDRTINSAQGGLGIGLTLVRSLVLLHDGDVNAHSAGPGRGSEFIVRLPSASPTTSATPQRIVDRPLETPIKTNNHLVAAAGRRLVLVDDNVDLGRTTAAILKAVGHDVHLCHSGAEALRVIAEARPEVAFIDIGMPDMSGYDVARAIRRQSELDGVALIAMTGYGQAEDRRRSREAGFDAHLVKPVGIADLQNILAAPLPAPSLTAAASKA